MKKNDIIKCLKANKDVTDYELVITDKDSRELFYVLKHLEINRAIIEIMNTMDPDTLKRIRKLVEVFRKEDENYLTIAGFILYKYQKFPKLNETIVIDNYTFKVLEAHNNRIDLVRLKINEKK